jgi:hypothetical protein
MIRTYFHVSSVAHFVGSEHFGLRTPGSGALAWGYPSVRQLRRLVE